MKHEVKFRPSGMASWVGICDCGEREEGPTVEAVQESLNAVHRARVVIAGAVRGIRD